MICNQIKPIKKELFEITEYAEKIGREMGVSICNDLTITNACVGDACELKQIERCNSGDLASFHTHPSNDILLKLLPKEQREEVNAMVKMGVAKLTPAEQPSRGDYIWNKNNGYAHFCIGTIKEGHPIIKCFKNAALELDVDKEIKQMDDIEVRSKRIKEYEDSNSCVLG